MTEDRLWLVLGPDGPARSNILADINALGLPVRIVDPLDLPLRLDGTDVTVVFATVDIAWSVVASVLRHRPTVVVHDGQRVLRRDAPAAVMLSTWRRRVAREVARTATPDGSGPPVLPARVVNLRVDGPVAPAGAYRVGICVDLRRPESVVVADAEPFPAEHLPRSRDGWWLRAVVSDGSGRPVMGDLYLPRIGGSFACGCRRGRTHTCQPADRADWLYLAVTAPDEPGVHELRVALYWRATVVQALALDVPVWPEPGQPAAHVTFSLSFDFADLDRFDGRTVSILGADLPGPAGGVLVGGAGDVLPFDFGADRATAAARRLRGRLFDAMFDVGEPGTGLASAGRRTSLRPRYDDDAAKPVGAYLADLETLARAGAEAYLGLLPDRAGRTRLREWLGAAAADFDEPALVQVARGATDRLAVPWQLVYDEPLGAEPRFCDSAREFGPGGPGAGTTTPPTTCPYEHSHRTGDGVFCPFGFWGLAHVLEVPPWAESGGPPEVTGPDGPIEVVLSADAGRDGAPWRRHVAEVRAATGTAGEVAASVRALRERVAHGVDLLYVVCHGVRESGDVLLDFGTGGRLRPAELATWPDLPPQVLWLDRRPLVILNGCHTGEVLPDSLVDFVSALTGSTGAAGVLVSEVALDSAVAYAVSEAFLRQWCAGPVGVGAALRAARWQLLGRGNLMGLAYTPYCASDLRLPRGTT